MRKKPPIDLKKNLKQDKKFKNDISCATKKSFETEKMALEVLSFHELNGAQEVYKCRICNKFHFWTKNKKISEKRLHKQLKQDHEIALKRRKNKKMKY